jgi:hypothetical protein
MPDRSHYVLMAQETALSWRQALERYLHTFRVTSGQSVDDALRLAATEHRITLVGSPTSVYGVSQEVEDHILNTNPDVIIDRMSAKTSAELKDLADMRAERGDRYGARDGEQDIVEVSARYKIGVDCLLPIHDDGHYTPTSGASLIAGTGAHWVRLNFVLPPDKGVYHDGSWSGPGEAPWLDGRFRATNKTWYETFDQLVDGFRAQGLDVYGLVGTESTDPRWTPERMRTDPTEAQECSDWVRRYAESFAEIVSHFRAKVKHFESFNEPNGWHGGNTHVLHPYWYARCLVEIYKAVVIERGISDVTLLTGPIECPSFPSNLRDQYLEGRKAYLSEAYRHIDADPNWAPHKATHGYPFHGVGLHLYLYQNKYTSNQIVTDALRQYVLGFHDLVKEKEGATAAARKKIYVSEIAWMSGDTSTSVEEARLREANPDTRPQRGTLDTQNRYLEQALTALTALEEVGAVIWYGIQDTGEGPWGLYGQGPLDAANRKPSWTTFQKLATGSG